MREHTPVATQITLAMTDTDAMVRFYTAVLGIEFQPVDAYGTTLYRGMLEGVAFVLCPNSLAGVEAERSRHQFTYAVADLAATVAQAVDSGGAVYEGARGGSDSATVTDPDGNTIVFVQAGR